MELEVTKKVRLAIKAKLLELGVHVDEELPDYIMILIANRRTKVQMEDDLSLFLGDNTIKFTTWLFQVLKKLEEVTAAPPPSLPPKITEDAPSKTTIDAVKKTTVTSEVSPPEEPVVKTIVPTLEEKPSEISNAVKRKTSKSQISSGIKSPVLKKSKITYKSERSPVLSIKKSTRSSKSSLSPEKTNDSGKVRTVSTSSSSETFTSKKLDESNISTKAKVSSSSPKRVISVRSKSPITAPSRSLSSSSSKHGRSRSPTLPHTQLSSPRTAMRRDVQTSSPSRETKRRLVTINRDTIRSPHVETSSSLRSLVVHKTGNSFHSTAKSRSRSPLTNARKSLKSLVAVVKRHNEINSQKDEEYNPSRPAVTASKTKGISSVVHVTERPKRETKEHGSNNLLVRALADAQKSIVSHSMQSSFGKNSASTDGKEKESKEDDDGDDDKPIVISRRRKAQSDLDDSKQQWEDSDSRRKKKDGSAGNTKLSIKERLGYRIDKKSSRMEPEVRRRRYDSNELDDLESEDLESDFPQGVDGDFKIRIKVATSKSAKERNVTLEKFDDSSAKQFNVQPEILVEEPKRLSIQLNVDSESSDDEDELEIQPRPTEDTNFESASTPTTSTILKEKLEEEGQGEVKNEEKQSTPSVSSNSENYSEGEESKENKSENKSEKVIHTQRSSSETSRDGQQLKKQDNDDDDDEEEEMEEYEIEEEEEEDEEYNIQDRNFRLPEHGDYDGHKKATIHDMEVRDNDEYLSNQGHQINSPMDKETLYLTNSPGSFDMDTDGGLDGSQNDYARYAVVKSLNRGDTKFVVTMDGNHVGNESEHYVDEMETDQYGYSPNTMDLRHRISRTVVQSNLSSSMHHNFSSIPSTPLTSSLYNASSRAYLPITGAPIRPAAISTASGTPHCKYWPDCTFKDKCVYPHPKCKYGQSCTKPNCAYKHETVFSTTTFDAGHSGDLSLKAPNSSAAPNENDGKVQCKFFPKCHSMSCTFYHPSPCRFGVGCTNIKCKSYHPGQTVGQQRSQTLPFGGSSSRTSNRIVPPAAHLLRWKAPSSTLESATKDPNPASSSSSISAASATA